jgi:adenylyltransferase/sulfurtransferase
MAIFQIPAPLRFYTNGVSEIIVQGTTVSEAIDDFIEQFPVLRQHLFDKDGQLRPFVNLFLGENNIKELQGLDTPLRDKDRVILIPSIAGG